MTEQTDAEIEADFEKEIADWPEAVKRVARQYPAYKCWRSKEDPEFHYVIIDYAHVRETGAVTVTLVHGSGTRRAGVATFGQPPEQLLPCACGKWEAPTAEEKRRMGEHIQKHKRRGRA